MQNNQNDNNNQKGYTITIGTDQYFVYGNTRIKIAEHFPETGKTLSQLLEELVIAKIKSESSSGV